MPVYKNKDNGTWYVMTQYTDWKGERKPKCKRGFATKREAQDWEQKFQQQSSGDLDMPFSAFVEIYCREQQPRLKESTWQTKENIIQQKILPYFKDRKINEITTKDVRAWQNEMLAYRNEENKPYSSSYLKTLHNQLSAIFNYAVRFYDLRSNPASKAGNMGSEERKEMLFWTKEEYQKFSEVMMDKPLSYYAFQMLYWTGIREGELLALTPADFDFEKGTVKISKTYQRLKGQDVITSPKTKKSNRTVQMPDFLCTEIQEFFGMQYGLKKKDRVFTVTKSYLHHEMDRGAKEAGVKRIRIHDLRHSHDCAILLVGHMNKGSGNKSSYRGLGSIDFQASARSVLIVGRIKDNPQVRVIVQDKSSLAPEGEAIAFELDKENGFSWIGHYDISVDDLLSGIPKEKKSEQAENLILEYLSKGKYPQQALLRKAQAMGISKRVLDEAKKSLNVQSIKEGSQWYWHLPEKTE